MNYDNLSDEQIDQMVAEKLALRAPSFPKETDFNSLSDEDLDRMVAEKLQGNQGQDRPVQAAVAGFGNAASFGYLPQIQAGVEKGVDYIFGDNTDEKLRDQGFQIAPEKTYTETRDQYIKDNKSLQESNPVASIAGGIAGGVASGVATGGALGLGAKTASVGARLGAAAKTGAAVGVIRNPGDTEGEIDLVQFQDRLKNASMDAVTGMVLQGGAEGVGKMAKAIKSSPAVMKNWSQIKAVKASGAMLKDFRKSFGNKKVAEMGQTMIDNKLISVGDDVADIAKKAEIMKAHTGNQISKIYEGVDDSIANIDASKLTPDHIKALQSSELDLDNFSKVYMMDLTKRMKGLSGGSTVVNRIEKELGDIAVNGKVGLKKLQEVRRSIDEQINFSKSTQELKGVQEELLGLRNKIQDLAKQRVSVVDQITGKRMARDLIKANKEYSNLAEISKISSDKVARDSSNAAFGLRERISGGAGAVVGGMIGGIPGAAIGGVVGSITTKVAKEFGTPLVAISANRVARALENNKSLLGKFADPLIKGAASPKEFVSMVSLMMKDPEFKKKVDGINLNDFKSREVAGDKP